MSNTHNNKKVEQHAPMSEPGKMYLDYKVLPFTTKIVIACISVFVFFMYLEYNNKPKKDDSTSLVKIESSDNKISNTIAKTINIDSPQDNSANIEQSNHSKNGIANVINARNLSIITIEGPDPRSSIPMKELFPTQNEAIYIALAGIDGNNLHPPTIQNKEYISLSDKITSMNKYAKNLQIAYSRRAAGVIDYPNEKNPNYDLIGLLGLLGYTFNSKDAKILHSKSLQILLELQTKMCIYQYSGNIGELTLKKLKVMLVKHFTNEQSAYYAWIQSRMKPSV